MHGRQQKRQYKMWSKYWGRENQADSEVLSRVVTGNGKSDTKIWRRGEMMKDVF